MTERTFILRTSDVRTSAQAYVGELPIAAPPLEIVVRPHSEERNLDQNAAMWSALRAISEQVVWHGSKLTPENWKDMMTASLRGQKAVPGIDGGFVVLGSGTRRMLKRDMSDLLDLIYAFGAEHGVRFPVARGDD